MYIFLIHTSVPNTNINRLTSLIILASFMWGRLWKMLPTIKRQSSDRY
ncbi:MAG: hypothetical protein F6K23_19895 [Okeania sp. SIO2C9]|nr:hypothetical protein [Okeania sp. SIO2C9]NEQ75105.1 hypothetical protein [Okeania sp. SIO2C9]NEQ75107.1 hypothetical protein [Okeania sp. SIO2C9]